MKSLSIPALLTLVPLLSCVGRTQAEPQLNEPLPQVQSPIAEVSAEVSEIESEASNSPTEIELISESQSQSAEQQTSYAETLDAPLTVPLYDLPDPRHSFHDNCPGCGMG